MIASQTDMKSAGGLQEEWKKSEIFVGMVKTT